MLIAFCTKQMIWFGTAGFWLNSIGVHRAGTLNLYKVVAFLFAIPCFKISNSFFKLALFLQQRRLHLLGVKCALMSGEDYSLEFENLPLFLNRPAQIKERIDH